MKSFLFLVLVLLSTNASYSATAFGPSETSPINDEQPQIFLPVTEAYQPLLSREGGKLLVQWSIHEGYYLYRERFATRVTVNGQPVAIKENYAQGIIKQDPYFGATEVYYYNTEYRVSALPKDIEFDLEIDYQGCADAGLCYPPQTLYYRVQADGQTISQLTPARANTATPTPQKKKATANQNGDQLSLWLALAFAALGGAILNLMPCVFPVLGLKVLSFANAERGSPTRHGLVYSLGVISSFVIVALILVSLQAAGSAVGWGFQLQTPWFVALLSSLFFMLSLNLLGVYEIYGRWTGIGSELSRQSGYPGSFFTGVLATLVASPCTAPFMGSAVGFAATQDAATSVLIFASIGLGMALPVFLLTLYPRWLQLLPPPGKWMLVFRQSMAFPLLAAALWLAWVVGRQLGPSAMAAIIGVWLLLGFALWLAPLGRSGKTLAVASLLAVALISGNAFTTSSHPDSSRSRGGFDPQLIDELRNSGQAVFVDVTADWCITCAANESLVLNTQQIQDTFERANIHYIVADWTRYDPAITQFLSEFGRNGIPLYVFYPAALNSAPVVLPQLLTKRLVLDAIGE